jgi:hypothetical protein
MKEYMAALDAMSAHCCDNAFFDSYQVWSQAIWHYACHSIGHDALIRVGHNCQTFVDSMSTNVRVRVDNLMETLFRSQRTTLSNRQNFLRTNFRCGAMRLTMLSSHHWPGMMFAFLLLLLTPMGAEICCSCFLDEDVEEPDFDWDSAPGFDLDNVYKLPILRQHVNHGNDIHHTLTRNSDDKVQDPGEVPPDDSSSDS